MLGGQKHFEFKQDKCYSNDVLSLGYLLLELCTLKKPYDAEIPDIGYMYSRKLQELLYLLLSEERPNAEALFNKLCKWIILGKSFVNRFG